ncbi:MAG: RDD family protein [Candidatus Schekmanbacteria bacterium]|nr:RDD family protein [Candidatus Schekmanbacteria bacterium]
MSQDNPIPGFWIRFLATLLDVALLAALVLLSTFIPQVKAYLYRLGEISWMGSVILLVYFTICHSSIMEGQTLGKKIFKIQVVRDDGVYLGLGQSLLYYLTGFYTLPFLFVIGLFCDNIFKTILWGGVYLALVLGETILIAYHPLKQGGSDHICGTLVTGVNQYRKNIFKTFYNGQQARFAFIAAVAASLAIIFLSGTATFMLNRILTNNQEQLESVFPKTSMIMLLGNDEMYKYNSDLIASKIKEKTSFQKISFNHTYGKALIAGSDSIQKTHILNVIGYLEDDVVKSPRKMEMETSKLANIIVENYGYLTDVNYINITGRSGFDIGIASQYHKENFQFAADGTPLDTKAVFLTKEQIGIKEIAKIALTGFDKLFSWKDANANPIQ